MGSKGRSDDLETVRRFGGNAEFLSTMLELTVHRKVATRFGMNFCLFLRLQYHDLTQVSLGNSILNPSLPRMHPEQLPNELLYCLIQVVWPPMDALAGSSFTCDVYGESPPVGLPYPGVLLWSLCHRPGLKTVEVLNEASTWRGVYCTFVYILYTQ